MAYYGEVFTPEVSSGNVATVLDIRDTTKSNNGARNPLGAKFRSNVVSAANPNGYPVAYRYVRYNSTANAATQASPAGVFWTDNTFTTVTSTKSEALGGTTGGPSFPAGVVLQTSARVTAAQLNGNFIWIQVAGFLSGVLSPSAAAGDQCLLTGTDWTTTGGFTKVTVATAPTGRVVSLAVAAAASNVADMYLCFESL